jgi:hypothetical protein
MSGALQQQIETACIKGGVATGLCGGFSTVFLSTEFWGVLIGLIGAAAAWWGVIRRERRESEEGASRLAMDRVDRRSS